MVWEVYMSLTAEILFLCQLNELKKSICVSNYTFGKVSEFIHKSRKY